MNKVYEWNQSDKKLVVDSIEVLHDVKGGGLDTIKKSVQAVQSQATAFNLQQRNYWNALASDGIITPVEKKQLKREVENITASFNAIWEQAVAQQLQTSSYMIAFKEYYDNFIFYIYSTIKLFDAMQENTLVDADTFNTWFSEYYNFEKFTQIALNTGIMGNLGFRVLSGLNEPGEEGEVGLYHGQIYQYVDGAWQTVGLEGYLGLQTSIPVTMAENQYFMVEESFNANLPLFVNGHQLQVVTEGELQDLYVNVVFEQGFIYVYQSDSWRKVRDTTDYRYIMAMNDYINTTGELPGFFQVAIQNYANQAISQMHVPGYLGAFTNDPMGAQEGDYYCYIGTDSANRHNSDIYAYINSNWTHYDPTDPTKSSFYMDALDDILKQGNMETGRFGAIFAATFFAHRATVDALQTKTIILSDGGNIQSDNYLANTRGFFMDGDSGDAWIHQLHAVGADVKGTIRADVLELANGVTIAGNKITGSVSNANTANNSNTVQGSTVFDNQGFIRMDKLKVEEILGSDAIFKGTLQGGDGYFRKLGFYEIQSGNYQIWDEKFNGNVPTLTKDVSVKVRFTPCCYSSKFKIRFELHAGAAGDTGNTPDVNLGVYIKQNGSVSKSNYDYKQEWSEHSLQVPHAWYDRNYENIFNFNNVTDYLEILFTYNTSYIPIQNYYNIKLFTSTNNPLIGRFAIFENISS